jgi:hypothetical protein
MAPSGAFFYLRLGHLRDPTGSATAMQRIAQALNL